MGPAFRRSRFGALLLAGALACYAVPRTPFYAPGTHAQPMQAKADVLNALLLADSSDLGPVARDTRLSLVLDWEDPGETNGTGGGVSTYFPRPAWQAGNGVVDPQLNPKGMRSVPDVSADADPASGAAVFAPLGDGTSAFTEGGGTSQSAPIWAGIAALIDQYLQQQGLPSVGFMNPALYHIAAHPDPATAFHDVTIGTNLYYPATPGYDLATGLGTPDVWNLAQDLENYERGGRR